MTESCKMIMHRFNSDEAILSSSKYLDFIYGDIMKKISTQIQENTASDYDILLYVYIILTEAHPIPTNEKIINGNILNTIIWNASKKWRFLSTPQGNAYDAHEKHTDGIFHDAYEEEVQNTADGIYRKSTKNIANTKNVIEHFREDEYKKLTEEIAEKKYEELLLSYKCDRYMDLSKRFSSDIYEFLNKRFPRDKYEEFIINIADDIFTKIPQKISENFDHSTYRETVKDIAENRYSELVRTFKSEKHTEYLLRFIDYNEADEHDKFIQRFVDDICGVLDKKFPLGKYEKTIKNIANDVYKKLLENITVDRRLIGRCGSIMYDELTEDIIYDKYDELLQIYASEKHGDLVQIFAKDIYNKLVKKFADDGYEEFIKNIADDKYEKFIAPIAVDKTEEFAEYIIYVLYIWLADHGILSEYNSQVKTISEDKEIVFDPDNDYDDAVELWKYCKKHSSRYNYYYHKKFKEPKELKEPKEPSRNIKNLKNHFVGILSGMKKSAYTFFPSFVTLIINNLNPQKHNKNYNYTKCDFEYDRYMPNLGYSPNDTKFSDSKNTSIFLKLIIAFENYNYGPREQHDIESWFNKKKEELGKRELPDIRLEEYIKSLDSKDKKLAKELFATSNRKPDFYLSYFDIFFCIHDKKISIPWDSSLMDMIDFTLSLFHLNIFTRWYDAFLLIEGMPFEFLRYNTLYLKLLTIPYIRFEGYNFLDVVKELIMITDMDLKLALINKNPMIELEDIAPLFYRKSRKKICDDDLIDIFYKKKNSNKRKTIKDINPIYKLIYLLDNPDLDNKRLDDLLYTNYQKYLDDHKDPLSMYGKTTIIKDSNPEYEDGYD